MSWNEIGVKIRKHQSMKMKFGKEKDEMKSNDEKGWSMITQMCMELYMWLYVIGDHKIHVQEDPISKDNASNRWIEQVGSYLDYNSQIWTTLMWIEYNTSNWNTRVFNCGIS